MENEAKKKKITCSCCNQAFSFKIFTKRGFDYYRCGRCGLVFIYPTPKDAELIYSRDYFDGAKEGFGYVNYSEDKEAMRGTFVSYLELLEEKYPYKGKLLDVGAASGFFIKLANERGWQAQGIELSEYAVNLGKKKGLEMFCGKIEDLNFPENYFDVITMWDVLEHLSEPRHSLKKIFKWLKPGALVAINTPDTKSLYARIMGKSWHLYIPPEHIFLYNSANLTRLCDSLGFEFVLKGKIGKKYTMPYVFSVLFHGNVPWFFKKLNKLIGLMRIDNIHIPINLRDNFLIVFKKPL